MLNRRHPQITVRLPDRDRPPRVHVGVARSPGRSMPPQA